MAQITLFTASTATSAVPTLATNGAALPGTVDLATLFLHSTAGSATMTVTCRLWGYNTQLAKWYPLGAGTAAGKGVINAGAAIAEDIADTILHCEVINSLHRIQRVYLQITAIGGTDTAVTAVLDCLPATKTAGA